MGILATDFNVYGYSLAQTLVQVLRQCGDGLTRENIMQQAAQLTLDLPLLLPGIHVHTTPTEFFPSSRCIFSASRVDGVLFGDVIGG
jgi:branched-chain amino acid transport system substrate-binding protein